jgi:hypothetical protein
LAGVFAVRRPAAALAGAVLALTLLGCTSDQADPPERQPQATSTALSDFATDDVSVARGEFCARVAPGAVTEALAGLGADRARWA